LGLARDRPRRRPNLVDLFLRLFATTSFRASTTSHNLPSPLVTMQDPSQGIQRELVSLPRAFPQLPASQLMSINSNLTSICSPHTDFLYFHKFIQTKLQNGCSVHPRSHATQVPSTGHTSIALLIIQFSLFGNRFLSARTFPAMDTSGLRLRRPFRLKSLADM